MQPQKRFLEEDALKNVFPNDIFLKYYKEYRPRITQEIYWLEDLSLPVGVDFRRTVTPKGEQLIRLRHMPARLEDTTKIAHELHHIVIDNAGFPSTGYREQKYENVSSSLSSMLHDLLVEEFQLNYGFDIIADYEAETAENRRQLENNNSSPSDLFSRCRWIFNYCGSLLTWHLLSEAKIGDHSFHLWFDKHYPDIAVEARELQKIIGDSYKTPIGMYNIFANIIERYKIGNHIILLANTHKNES